MTNEPSVEKIVARIEPCLQGYYLMREEVRVLIADWRKRGDALTLAQADYEAVLNNYVKENHQLHDRAEIAEKELEALSASHKDLSHRLAQAGEALIAIRDAGQIEMAPDPAWSSRIARAALAPKP